MKYNKNRVKKCLGGYKRKWKKVRCAGQRKGHDNCYAKGSPTQKLGVGGRGWGGTGACQTGVRYNR